MNRTGRPVGTPSRRLRGDGGLAIVEFAIVAPLLALLAAGVIEFGMAWRDNLTVSSASRAAARVASNLGNNNLADYEALLTLEAALASMEYATLEGVLIYDGGKFHLSRVYENLELVDRVGGGDSFSSAVIYSLLNAWPIEKACEFAGAYSALAHTFPGDMNWATFDEAVKAASGSSARISR